jgi:uncharacterized protein with PQ loop repeat
MWNLIASCGICMTIAANLPQIIENHKAKSTGNLAFQTVIIAFCISAGKVTMALIESGGSFIIL